MKADETNYLLFGSRRSGSLIVELALAEIGCAYTVQDIDLEVEAQREESYAAVNPQCKVPTLVTPHGETLTESAAILLTLDDRYPDACLLPPTGSKARAEALRWLLFVATELYPIVEINDYPERFVCTPKQALATRERAREIWRHRWVLVEEHIAGNPYLLPWGFSASDIYIAVVSRWAQQESWRSTHIPKVERLTSAVSGRPKLEVIWRRHDPKRIPGRFK